MLVTRALGPGKGAEGECKEERYDAWKNGRNCEMKGGGEGVRRKGRSRKINE